jgi:hypothetical protein
MNGEDPRWAKTGGGETPRLFLLFNHRLTPGQEVDASMSLGVKRLVPLPTELKRLWAHIPADLPTLQNYLEPLAAWLMGQAHPGDFVLIQGDFGACFFMVQLALKHGLVPVYATTQRVVVENPLPDGSVQVTRRFEHQIFRRYGE